MTNPKRPESLDRAIRWVAECLLRAYTPGLIASLEDALDVLRAERERRRGQ